MQPKWGGYSTTEIKTGEKWIDGRDIYRRTFEYTVPNQTYTTDINQIAFPNINLNAALCIKSYGTVEWDSAGDAIRVLPYPNSGYGPTLDSHFQCNFTIRPGSQDIFMNMGYQFGNRYKGQKIWWTFEYVKSL